MSESLIKFLVSFCVTLAGIFIFRYYQSQATLQHVCQQLIKQTSSAPSSCFK